MKTAKLLWESLNLCGPTVWRHPREWLY
uniref:Uncharacterized protein n=1 Tax=Anguilla anguilla TaxID=7936 RepID=A0A0E9VM79_ANGAN